MFRCCPSFLHSSNPLPLSSSLCSVETLACSRLGDAWLQKVLMMDDDAGFLCHDVPNASLAVEGLLGFLPSLRSSSSSSFLSFLAVLIWSSSSVNIASTSLGAHHPRRHHPSSHHFAIAIGLRRRRHHRPFLPSKLTLPLVQIASYIRGRLYLLRLRLNATHARRLSS